LETFSGRDQVEDIGADTTMILKQILENGSLKQWIRFNWFRVWLKE
jgi:hypothetical protein